MSVVCFRRECTSSIYSVSDNKIDDRGNILGQFRFNLNLYFSLVSSSKCGHKLKRVVSLLQKQTTLDAFFKAKPYTAIDTCKVSERVIRAINIMKNNVDVDVSALPAKSPRKKNNSKASPGKKSTPKKRERQPSKSLLKAFTPTKPGSSMGAPEKIPQRERSRLEAAKRKTEAAELLRKTRKYQAKKKKRGVLQPKADSSYLSESSSGEG